MGLFDKLFGGKTKEKAAETAVAIDCPHAVLVPRWENVQEMGHEDKITRFMCEACKEEFAPDVARQLRDTINERMGVQWAEQQAAEESKP